MSSNSQSDPNDNGEGSDTGNSVRVGAIFGGIVGYILGLAIVEGILNPPPILVLALIGALGGLILGGILGRSRGGGLGEGFGVGVGSGCVGGPGALILVWVLAGLLRLLWVIFVSG